MMLCSKKFKKRKASTTNAFQASSALLWRDTLCKIIVFSTLIEIYFFDLAVFIFINKLLRGHFNNIVKWYFDYRSLVHHFEDALWMYSSPEIARVRNDFIETLKVSREMTPNDAKLSPFEWFVKCGLRIFAPLL